MAPRLASPATLAVACGVLVLWMVVTLWDIRTDVASLSAKVDAGLAGLEGKLDLLTGQLRHVQPGGFHDSAPRGAAGGGDGASFLQATRTLNEQLQRISQGVANVEQLKQRLEAAVQLAEASFAAGGKNGGGGDVRGGGAAVGHARRGGERGLKSESDFGKPASLHSSPPDNANEALWQQTIKMNPGDPLPLVGRAFHPWWSNADHSREST